MFDYIKGKLVSINSPFCTLEANSMGWLFLVNNRTVSKLKEIESDTEIKLFSKLIHKEDQMYLCGFLNKEERTIFDILLSVSGVGTKAAFSLLDEFEAGSLISAVINEDFKLISKTKGIGLKTAQKIVLELKDKLTKLDFVELDENINSKNGINSSCGVVSNDSILQAKTILQSLGYSENEYSETLYKIAKTCERDDPEELLKLTLKTLSVF